jgi:hypothetical protein
VTGPDDAAKSSRPPHLPDVPPAVPGHARGADTPH